MALWCSKCRVNNFSQGGFSHRVVKATLDEKSCWLHLLCIMRVSSTRFITIYSLRFTRFLKDHRRKLLAEYLRVFQHLPQPFPCQVLDWVNSVMPRACQGKLLTLLVILFYNHWFKAGMLVPAWKLAWGICICNHYVDSGEPWQWWWQGKGVTF